MNIRQWGGVLASSSGFTPPPPTFTAFGVTTGGGAARVRRSALLSGAPVTGSAASKRWTISAWLKPAALASSQNVFGSTPANAITMFLGTTGSVVLIGRNAGNTQTLRLDTPAAMVSVGAITHVMWSVDLANAANRWCRINGVNQSFTVTTFDTTSELNWAMTEQCFGANPGGGVSYNGAFAELWMDAQFIANTDANVLKFISSVLGSGQPIDLGATGTTPGFGQPLMYFSRRNNGSVAVDDFDNNLGSGGTFAWAGTGQADGGSFGGV